MCIREEVLILSLTVIALVLVLMNRRGRRPRYWGRARV